jgi:hypothetical protein
VSLHNRTLSDVNTCFREREGDPKDVEIGYEEAIMLYKQAGVYDK